MGNPYLGRGSGVNRYFPFGLYTGSGASQEATSQAATSDVLTRVKRAWLRHTVHLTPLLGH